MKKHWTSEDIPWDRFEADKVDPEILKAVKAAAMVEKNSADYATYLRNVFPDDEAFKQAADDWALEEVQHGDVLGSWAEMADPSFDFTERFARFQEGYRIPLDATESVRGSRAGELVARCVVEVGTSSYYTSLAGVTEEPVLRAICQRIAGDEFRHYKLFYSHLKRYQELEQPSTFAKLRVAVTRMIESDDDELAYAYYAANNHGEPYERRANAQAYAFRAYSFYCPATVERGVAMTFKAAGFNPQSRVARLASRAAWHFMGWRHKRLAQAEAHANDHDSSQGRAAA